MIEKPITKLPEWKPPGTDGVQGYWFKSIKAIKLVLEAMLNKTLQWGNVL